MITESTFIKTNSTIKPVSTDKGLSMLNVDTGKYVTLNSIGSIIWEYMTDFVSVREIITKLVDEYDILYDECKKSVIPYVEELIKEKLVVVINR